MKNNGSWVKYNKESLEVVFEKARMNVMPEYLKLYNSVKDFNTGWYMTSKKELIKNQLSGNGEFLGGDVYIYYTLDDNNRKVPRIMVRMCNDSIREIRGIDYGQNLEIGLFDKIIDLFRLYEFSKSDRYLVLKQLDNLYKLEWIHEKVVNNEVLNLDELLFMSKDVQINFGVEKDKKIDIINAYINKNKLWEYTFQNISYRRALNIIKDDPWMIVNVPNSYENYSKLCKYAVRKNDLVSKTLPQNNKKLVLSKKIQDI